MTTSYVPEDGDEVEVVLRGKAVLAKAQGWFYLDGNLTVNPHEPQVVSITRVTPALPTTLDSKVDAAEPGGRRGEWLMVEEAPVLGGVWCRLGSSSYTNGVNLTVHSVLRVGGAA